ncbi:2-amino-4-hydroxy-6-hydroxymethyldihydropteridine diphosphokinase [Bermanella marisrubri]|uniref:2-amino-4-hydroxy-6-hydroxymethyldihydropteridine pyrophosphokinase n=1 Tax=Bermanella marisrubri TaxID=207949 RepID=Q1N0Z3_9GAMM|nr:2-amino-4-hydroxy-6-hydroxymethyldihydropteridine diphosphokinase [Bermanella marisrubri]EAT11881.1 2-amino-4-hydroxy-6-hydroxymethyldihydropteridine diphosphokinase [Oceanobacter sp. RED65] [Bermanella marisrubri]QIZ83042.1 2-amino-4-hydroxy-6-hydroxymethyldihydropteridine diphosphokinase [Bermanella marisrubri]
MNYPHTVYIGLGSNLDDPIDHVSRAILELDALQHCQLRAQSPIYRSKPVGPQDQPDFINAVVCLNTALLPHDLLDKLQDLEQQHLRVRKRHWGERTLDLDLLLFDQAIIRTPRLTVPHSQIAVRSFVLYPLSDIAPNSSIPGIGSLNELLNQVDFDLEKVEIDN